MDEAAKEAYRAYRREYYARNRANILKYQKDWRKKNREKIRAYKREYYAKNRERIQEYQRRWREQQAQKLGEGGKS